jgi:hypothetical protein
MIALSPNLKRESLNVIFMLESKTTGTSMWVILIDDQR